MKTFYFFTGLPRAGNTIFSAILNENPDIYATGHSFVPDIFYAIKEARKILCVLKTIHVLLT